MHEIGLENIKWGSGNKKSVSESWINKSEEDISESVLEEKLEKLLEKLGEVRSNFEEKIIDLPVLEAISVIEEVVKKRMNVGEHVFVSSLYDNGINTILEIPDGVLDAIEDVQRNPQELGRGNDAFVITDDHNTHVCYKIAIIPDVVRGRNTITDETFLQEKFYELAQLNKGTRISVPMPQYCVQTIDTEILIMEKLHAATIDQLLGREKQLPEWFTYSHVDTLTDGLKKFLDEAHKKGLYHRDLHLSNFMISLDLEEGEYLGFVIDFGLSKYFGRQIDEEMTNPYVAQYTPELRFTYNKDYGILITLKDLLYGLIERRESGI